jgi:hypothetical protein
LAGRISIVGCGPARQSGPALRSLSFVGVATMLGVIATIASVVPAMGILRIDPAKILRD